MNPGGLDYIRAVQALIGEILRGEAEAISRAADLVTDAAVADRLVHLFGAGHSQLLVEEGFFRAGGLAFVNPLLVPEVALGSGPLAATEAEQDVNVADLVFNRYRILPGEVVIVFSNSGVNPLPVEVARRARLAGASVVAVASRQYMAQARPTHPDRLTLADVTDVLIDNHVPAGDAMIGLPGAAVAVGPASTVAGATILQAVLVETACRLAARGLNPPVYVSGKLPGANEHNAALVRRYQGRIALLVPPSEA